MAYVVWDDTRNGDAVTSTTNLPASSAQYKAATGIPKTLGYVLAVVVGLGVVGLVLLIGSKAMGRSRRPAGPPPAAAAQKERDPVSTGSTGTGRAAATAGTLLEGAWRRLPEPVRARG